ncbi:hypothetical protein AVEN_31557-1, partial [Araneus ventricosus]
MPYLQSFRSPPIPIKKSKRVLASRLCTEEVSCSNSRRVARGFLDRLQRFGENRFSKHEAAASNACAKNRHWIQLSEKEEINDDVLIDDLLSLDSEAETSETLTELDILDIVKNKNDIAMNCDEKEDDEDGNDHDAEINKSSYDEMLIRSGLQFEE